MICAVVLAVFTWWEVEVLVVAGRLVRFGTLATDLIDEKPADRKGVVSDQLGGQAVAGLSVNQSVGGVSCEHLSCG